ncbi:MAG: hypothetical protein IPK26_17815 [Planctomycetes bacterium]|nr:hypothetical protein [Planctomycetota bacterium]
MRYICSSPLAALAAACSFAPAPAWPRPALPTPPAVRARFALPELPVPGALQTLGNGSTDGELHCGSETARFHWRPRTDGTRGPAIVLVPILAGGADLMTMLASRLQVLGYHVGWCDRVASALQPPQRGQDLETLFRRTVIHQRMLLQWLRQRPEVDAGRQFVLGVSMGGIVASAVAVAEPDLAGVGICIAGADLPDLVLHSGEVRVQKWVDWRTATDGIGAATLSAELRHWLVSDPARLSPYVPTDKVVLVSATLDDVIPARHRDLLWEALGRPRRLQIPLGHYSMALALDGALAEITDFFAATKPPALPLPGG